MTLNLTLAALNTPRRARGADTHPSCPLNRDASEKGARQIVVRPEGKHSTVMLFFYLFLLWRSYESVADKLY